MKTYREISEKQEKIDKSIHNTHKSAEKKF